MPGFGEIRIEVIANIEKVIGGDYFFSVKEISGVGLSAGIGEILGFCGDDFLKMGDGTFEEIGWRGEACGFGLDEKVGDIDGEEIDGDGFAGRPVAEATVVILAGAEDGEGIFELMNDFAFGEAEVGFGGEEEATEGGAGDLFRAPVWVIFEVEIEATSEAEWGSGDGGFEFSELWIDEAIDADFGGVFREISATDIGHEGGSGADADRGAERRFFGACGGLEGEGSGA